MNARFRAAALAVAASAATAMTASATVVGTITADNHYAVYADCDGMFFVGCNEEGAGGAPGAYNWSEPETWEICSDRYIYIAAWSDDSVAQGLIGSFTFPNRVGQQPAGFVTGDGAWQVFATNSDLDDGAPYPEAGEVAAWVAFADANNLWETPEHYASNGSSPSPWGHIDGISDDAVWMWRGSERTGDAFQPGGDHGEYLIFRRSVPAPSTLALGGLGALVAIRRRRA